MLGVFLHEMLIFSFSGPSGIQPVVKAAPITIHDSDSEDEEENMGTAMPCMPNSIAHSYSDGEEKSRDPVETREPSGVPRSFWSLSLPLGLRFISSLGWNVEMKV